MRAPVVGRAAELARLAEVAELAAGGAPRIVLLRGEAGVGKSTLLRAAAEAWAERGFRTGTGGSGQLSGQAVPFGPVRLALRRAGVPVDRLPDAGEPDLGSRHRRLDAFVDLVTAAAAEAPLLLCLEDLHWSDDATRTLLDYLAVVLDEQRVAVLVSTRPDAGHAGWQNQLARAAGVELLEIGPLADAEVRVLVGDLPAGQLDLVVARAAGNPHVALELAAGGGAIPASLQTGVLDRLAGLDAGARELVELLAVQDGPLGWDKVAAPGRQDAVDGAVASGLVTVADDAFGISHALTRDVVYGQLPPGRRRELHGRLAALAEDAGSACVHWGLAGDHARAWTSGVEAGRKAMGDTAYAEADAAYASALEHAGALGQPATEVLVEAAGAAGWNGRPARAVELLESRLGLLPADAVEARAAALERIGRYAWQAAQHDRSLAADREACALLAERPASVLQARVLAAYASGLSLRGDLEAAEPLARRAYDVATQFGAAAEISYAAAVLGEILAGRGDAAGAALLQESLDVAWAHRDPEGLLRAAQNASYTACAAGRLDEALGVIELAARRAVELGVPDRQLTLLRTNQAAVYCTVGRWDEALELLENLRAAATAQIAPGLLLLRLEIAVGRGEPLADPGLAGLEQLAATDPTVGRCLLALRVEAACWRGDAAQNQGDPLELLAPQLFHADAMLAAVLCRARAEGGLRTSAEEAREVAGALRGRAEAAEDPEIAAYLWLAAAEFLRAARVDARSDWAAALAAWERAGHRYRQAYTLLRAAEVDLRRGKRDVAEARVTQAQDIATALHAGPLLAALESLASRSRLSPRSRPAAAGPTELTARETEILGELAAGRTNREIGRVLFISERTVDIHVGRILTKLAIKNRAEAAALVGRVGLDRAARGESA